MVRGALTLLCSLLLFLPLQAEGDWETLLALMGEQTEEEQHEYLTLLHRLEATPLDLNKATREELLALPWFDSFFVHNLLLHRSQSGGLRSLYELKQVAGAPLAYLPYLEPFLTTSLATEPPLPRRTQADVGVALSRQRQRYTLYLRSEQSEGWSFAAASQHALSATLSYRKDRRQLLLGDFRVSMGEGLLMGSTSARFSRLAIRGTPMSGLPILRPHASTSRVGYLRGGALTLPLQLHRPTSFSLLAGVDPSTQYEVGALLLHHSREATHLTATAVVMRPHGGQAQRYLSLAATHKIGAWWLQGEGVVAPSASNGDTSSSLLSAYRASATYQHELWGAFTLASRYLSPLHHSPYAQPDSHYNSANNEQGYTFAWQGEVARSLQGVATLDLYRSLVPHPLRHSNRGRTATLRLTYTPLSSPHALTTATLRYAEDESKQRYSLRCIHRRSLEAGHTLLVGGQWIGSTTSSYALWSKFIYEGSRLHSEVGLLHFHANANPLPALTAWHPHDYYTPMLQGSGWQLLLALRYSIPSRGTLHLRLAPLLYTTAPSTPLPLTLHAAYSLRM